MSFKKRARILAVLVSEWMNWKLKRGWELIKSEPMDGTELGNFPQTKFFFEVWLNKESREIRSREI